MLASAPAAAAAGQPAPGPVPAATLTDAELSKKTIPELKKLCAAAGLKVGGNKSQLTIRLLGLDPAAPPKMRGSSKKVDVDAVLRASGIADLHRVNPCLKAAIAKGFIPMKDGKLDLEAELCSGRCLVCSNQMVATVQDVLYQRAVGDDYEDGNEGGALQCFGPRDSDDEEEEDLDGETHGIYITDLCVGRPSFSDGKFHQHCTECPGYGKCIGDYRNAHCGRCGKHYFAGSGGQFDCNCRDKPKKGAGAGRFGGRGRDLDLMRILFGF